MTRLDDQASCRELAGSFRVDDRVLGVSFFKTTDLRESNLCWNDFISVDSSDAILTNSDLRSSIFEHVASSARSPTRGSMAHDLRASRQKT